ncbi:hypothetical protein [Acinetobacter calcoaceticus]|uniref:hypothetical protein n=1 Tax=Acinetobacter calcoaceticus TaxID=471 RepID=UPI0012505437|nr:hypothetical protein [Acinetobacter calcoaceticus]
MECEVTNLEYFKASTPFILALFVYLVWHFQKSNEVLAEESKILISQINELMQINSELMSSIRNYSYLNAKKLVDLKIIESKMNDFDLKTEILMGTFNFLNEAIGENKFSITWIDWIYGFKRAYVSYSLEIEKIKKGQIFTDQEEEYILSIHNALVMNCNKLKRIFLKYAMYRNTGVFKLYLLILSLTKRVESVFRIK